MSRELTKVDGAIEVGGATVAQGEAEGAVVDERLSLHP